jgi:hypothetical protein
VSNQNQNDLSELELDTVDALAMFRLSMGAKFAPYDTEANLRAMAAWYTANCGGVEAGTQLGAWQLAFKACIANGSIQRNENHPILVRQRHEAEAAFRERVAAMSVSELKAACQGETGFSEKYASLVKAEDNRQQWIKGI